MEPSRLPWGCRTTCNPKSSACVRSGEREGVTEEVCEACPHWNPLPERREEWTSGECVDPQLDGSLLKHPVPDHLLDTQLLHPGLRVVGLTPRIRRPLATLMRHPVRPSTSKCRPPDVIAGSTRQASSASGITRRVGPSVRIIGDDIAEFEDFGLGVVSQLRST